MKIVTIAMAGICLSSCATLNESMTLGAGMGAAAGGLSTYVAQSTSGGHSSGGNILLGAGIGTAVGLITSYFTHKNVEERRASMTADQTEMHFGDLPPSPFVFQKEAPKKGARK